MDVEVLAGAGGIFLLRVIGNMLTTLRMVTIVRGQRIISSLIAVFEALIFALALGTVVTNLGNVWNLTAYCVGYAVGGYLGLTLEQRFVHRFVSVNIISPQQAHAIAMAIRDAGFGATEGWGQGAEGWVGSVTAVVGHREVNSVVKIVHEVDPDAFVMMEELRKISRGYFRFARPEH
jgi:uncharacterized protein YebE (UPF0316 family)